MNRVAIIDYGIGNLLSVERAMSFVGASVYFVRTAAEIKEADRILLPGVGAFTSCTTELKKRGLNDSIREFVNSGRPLLGICVGMQMLFDTSEEFGVNPGFGFIAGNVKAIPAKDEDGRTRKIPHINWTSLEMPNSRNSWDNTILKDTAISAEVYFVHSFSANPQYDSHRLADSSYDGYRISAAVAKDNIVGLQFHPEKSGPIGLKIIENFAKL